MKPGKVYAYGKHAVGEASKYAAHAVLKVFKDAKDGDVAQISLSRLLVPFDAFVESLHPTPDTALVLLAGVEDPHNFGAIIRSAAGLGASAVLMPQSGQAPVSSTVLKVSAGMAFRLPLVPLDNIQQNLSALKKRGFKIVALASSGRPIGGEPFAEPVVFILGNEGSGIPKAVRPLCDATLSIPLHPRCESLNVAAAAAVALGAWSLRHPGALTK